MTTCFPVAADQEFLGTRKRARRMIRPFSSLTIRSPWSAARALQTQTQQTYSILTEDLALVLLRDLRALGDRSSYLPGLRRIPMRRVGGKHKPVATEILHGPFEEAVLEWLATHINALVKNIRRPALLPRYKMRQFLPVFIHA